MDSTQIVLKRILDLKKLSNQLKEQSEKTSTVDTNLVKAILQTTKDVSPKRHQSNANSQLYNQPSNQQIPIFKMLLSPRNQKGKQSQKSINENNFKPLFPENANFPKRSPSSQQNELLQNQEEQIINLKEQNLVLQRQLKQAQEQLLIFKENSRVKDKKQSNMPFFSLSNDLEVFFTKLKIDERDYHKLEYEIAKVQLSLEYVVVNNKISNRQFEIDELVRVQYLDQTTILLEFFNDELDEIQSLFIRFKDKETHHWWDLGIYINYKINSSLEEEKLFQQQFKKRKEMHQKQVQKEERQKSILKQFLQKKEEYIKAQKQLRQSMIENIQDIKQKKQPSQISSQNSLNKQIFEFFREEERLVTQEQQNQSQKNDFLFQRIPEKTEEDIKREQQIKRKQEQEKQKQKQRQMEELRRLEQIRKQEQIMREKQRVEEERRRRQEESRRKHEEMLRVQRQNQLRNAVDKMKFGYILTKYAKGAYNPHEKKVYLNLDGTKLCWEDKDGKDMKSVNINDIISVHLGDIGEGIEKHIGPKKKIKNLENYGIILLKSKDRKSLEFGCNDELVLREFIRGLEWYVDEWK